MDVEALRAQTPGCAGRIHLNNAGAALLAQPTLDAMTAHLRREAEIGGYEAAAEARDAIAATYAWNAAFYSVPLRSGDQILTGRAEYGSNVLAYWQTARRAGAEVVVVPLGRAGVNVSTTVPGHNPLDTEDRGVHPLIRFSPHYYNTEEEIDRTTELVAALVRGESRS